MTSPAVQALTIRQPWARAVVYAGKNIENRRWQTSYRGPVLIHAAKDDDPAGAARVPWTMPDPRAFGHPGGAFDARGAIIGMVQLADLRTDSPSRWAQPHRFHWISEFPAPVDPPVPCSGRRRPRTPQPAATQAVTDLP